MSRNITLNLPDDLLRGAKLYAAAHDTSINALVKDLLEELVNRESEGRLAADRLLELAGRGPFSAIDPGTISRAHIYDRDPQR